MIGPDSSLNATEVSEVQLQIVDAHVPRFEGLVTLKLRKLLRHLAGRRDVWLASSRDESALLVAKRFCIGGKQLREYTSEVDGIKQLTTRGVLCPKLIFTANDERGDLWVVTEFIENSKELSDIVLHCSDPSVLKAATQEFANALIMHWQLGVHQTDAHLRNFLWDGQSIYTIDVGTIRFSEGPLALSKKTSILEKMLGGYIESFRADLIKAFIESCGRLGESELLNRIESAGFSGRIEQQEAKNLRRIWQKSRRNCSQFMKAQHGRSLLICQRELDPKLIEQLKNAPDKLMEMGQRLKSGNTCTVQQIEWSGVTIVVKRYNPKPIFYRIRHILHMSRAMRSWSNGIVMNQLDVPTVVPLAVVEESNCGLLGRAYFLMEHFEGESISDYLNRKEDDEAEHERAVTSLSRLFARLRQLRIVHGDFKAKNILINESGLMLIDTDGSRFLVNRRRFIKEFQSDFKRFLKNWPDGARVKRILKNRLSKIFDQ